MFISFFSVLISIFWHSVWVQGISGSVLCMAYWLIHQIFRVFLQGHYPRIYLLFFCQLAKVNMINDNVILSSDKRVIMKIITSAQVMYYFTSAKHEWNNTLRVHKWLFSLSRVYQTTITLSYYLFNNCFKYNFHYLRGW